VQNKVIQNLSVIGLCFGSLFLSNASAEEINPNIARRVLTGPLNDEQLRQYREVTLAYDSSQLSYKLPQVRAGAELEDYYKQYGDFVASLPKDYIVFGADGGLQSGLKFCVLKPSLRGNPWVIAIAGTESTIDQLADTQLGRQQLEDLAKIIVLFTEPATAQLRFLAEVDVLITGHSLGGALAQAVAHEIQKKRLQNGLSSKVKVVTFNSLGSQTLIKDSTGTYDESLLAHMEVAHYYLRGDMISRIDTHMGPTYELEPLPRDSGPAQEVWDKLLELKRFHSLDSFLQIIHERKGARLREAKVVPIPPADTINNLVSYSGILGYGTHVIHSFRQLHIVKKLTKELARVVPEDFNSTVKAEAIRFLYNVASRELLVLETSSDKDRRAFAPSLSAQINRLHLLLRDYAVRTSSLIDR